MKVNMKNCDTIIESNLAYQSQIMDCRNCPNMDNSSFCSLKKDEAEAFNEKKTSKFYKKGSIVFYENEISKGLYLVNKGKLKMYKTLADGNEQIMKLAATGDIIGYRGLLGNGKYIASAETIEDSIICFIPKYYLFELLTKNISLTLKLFDIFANDLAYVENKALRYLQKSSREKLAESLLELYHSYGLDQLGFINIKLRREELASLCGMASETVVRILKEFEENNILSLSLKKIGIKNLEELTRIAHLEA